MDRMSATVLREIETAAKICRKMVRARSPWQKMRPNGRVYGRPAARCHRLWRASAPNKLGEDITVPRSAIPEAVRRLKEVSAKYGLPIVIFGHAGDGNLHPNILFDKRDPRQWAKVEQMVAEEFDIALELGGTLSGEHGVGTLKRPYMQRALGSASVVLQKSIKLAFDPLNILNPGKVLPD